MTHTSSCRIAFIMAEGSGEGFWPLSQIENTKQFLKLGNNKHRLFGQTVINMSPLIQPARIDVATRGPITDAIRNDCSGIPQENIFVEPEKHNTAWCLIYPAADLLAKYGGDGSDITMATFPADHNIGNGDELRKLTYAALLTAEREDALITLCIWSSCRKLVTVHDGCPRKTKHWKCNNHHVRHNDSLENRKQNEYITNTETETIAQTLSQDCADKNNIVGIRKRWIKMSSTLSLGQTKHIQIRLLQNILGIKIEFR